MTRLPYAVGLLGTAVALTTGCAAGGGAAGTASSSLSSASVSASENAVAAPAQLNFVAKTVTGEEFSGASLAGKPAVLWFWTPWCPTCQGEAPEVAKVARDNPDVTFVGVSAQDQIPAMKEFADKYGTGIFTNIADVDGAVWQRFGVTGQPSFALISRDGSIEMVRGPLSEPDLAVQVANLKH